MDSVGNEVNKRGMTRGSAKFVMCKLFVSEKHVKSEKWCTKKFEISTTMPSKIELW